MYHASRTAASCRCDIHPLSISFVLFLLLVLDLPSLVVISPRIRPSYLSELAINLTFTALVSVAWLPLVSPLL